MDRLFPYPKMGHSFLEILQDPLTRKLLGHDLASEEDAPPFAAGVATRLEFLLRDPTKHLSFLKIGYSALEAFLQSNCTGPPLDFDSVEVVIPRYYRKDEAALAEIRRELLNELEVDGEPVYELLPHYALFWLGQVCMGNTTIAEMGFNGRRARFRVTVWHQKLLLEKSETLRERIYADADVLEHQLASRLAFHGAAAEEHFVEFLLERAAVRTYYGDDALARDDLIRATKTRKFQFALTGALGKRTKFQDHHLSQLVVLARSRDHEPQPYSSRRTSRTDGPDSRKSSAAEQGGHQAQGGGPGGAGGAGAGTGTGTAAAAAGGGLPLHSGGRSGSPSPMTGLPLKPENLLLNDDTLLESIHFKQVPATEAEMTAVAETSHLPSRLASLDPAHQPLLFPMDSIILLATASSITNTSPVDGLTREETLPYATRVLDGGSSNWQVYTQALLIRSRIEGYRSRTAERGLLQLQALVDQVIAELSSPGAGTGAAPTSTENGHVQEQAPSTFLPKPRSSESASVAERLHYIYQIAPPLRWELESELAARWVHVGGLKTALDIYTRLQMPAEVALCLAGTDQEAEAIHTIRKLLFSPTWKSTDNTNPTSSTAAAAADESTSPTQSYTGALLPPSDLPSNAPRLLCLLGDFEPANAVTHYTTAWKVSKEHYARAQRSLGKHYVRAKQFPPAVEAYRKALSINRLNVSTWFALGCVHLELEDWAAAVDAFTRTVQLDDSDGQAWSNLAIALLRLPEPQADATPTSLGVDSADIAPTRPDLLHQASDHYIGDIIEEGGSEEEEEEEEQQDSTEPTQRSNPIAQRQPTQQIDTHVHRRQALNALRRAAQLRREDARVWDNYLTVAASIPPPTTPWAEVVRAQRRVIELRGSSAGEAAVDASILTALVNYVVEEFQYPAVEREEREEEERRKKAAVDDEDKRSKKAAETAVTTAGDENTPAVTLTAAATSTATPDTGADNAVLLTPSSETAPDLALAPAATPSSSTAAATTTMSPGSLPRQVCTLIDNSVVPLITTSAALWLCVARLAAWRQRPAEALAAHERAWRAATTTAGSTSGGGDMYTSAGEQRAWRAAVDATLGLVRAYEELGGLERERTGGRVVTGDWRFKARSAVRAVMARAEKGGVWAGNPDSGGGAWGAKGSDKGKDDGWRRLMLCMNGLKVWSGSQVAGGLEGIGGSGTAAVTGPKADLGIVVVAGLGGSEIRSPSGNRSRLIEREKERPSRERERGGEKDKEKEKEKA